MAGRRLLVVEWNRNSPAPWGASGEGLVFPRQRVYAVVLILKRLFEIREALGVMACAGTERKRASLGRRTIRRRFVPLWQKFARRQVVSRRNKFGPCGAQQVW
jgi:hypothetical protein